MYWKTYWKYAALLMVMSFLVFGCAKKQVETTTQPGVSMEEQPGVIDEGMNGLSAEEEARLREEALQEEQRKAEEMQQAVSTIEENRIYFDFDSFELKPEAREVLQRKAEHLKQYPELTMTIAGHCDERGTEEYNLALGQRRAQAAYDFLVLLGVDGNRMKTVSFGEERPIATGSTEEAWAKNRRDEFKVHGS